MGGLTCMLGQCDPSFYRHDIEFAVIGTVITSTTVIAALLLPKCGRKIS